jgi:hypothetical protein
MLGMLGHVPPSSTYVHKTPAQQTRPHPSLATFIQFPSEPKHVFSGSTSRPAWSGFAGSCYPPRCSPRSYDYSGKFCAGIELNLILFCFGCNLTG